MNAHFKNWYDNADMPTQDANGWYDMETGIRYTPAHAKARVTHSAKTLNAREKAKFFGGKALKGTAKQVKWAEEIRAEKIEKMDADSAVTCCDPTDRLLATAKFWIENRTKNPAEIVAFARKTQELRAAYEAAKNSMDSDSARKIANEYNALTTVRGYE